MQSPEPHVITPRWAINSMRETRRLIEHMPEGLRKESLKEWLTRLEELYDDKEPAGER